MARKKRKSKSRKKRKVTNRRNVSTKVNTKTLKKKEEYSLEWKLRRRIKVSILTSIMMLITTIIIVQARAGLQSYKWELGMIKKSLPFIGIVCAYLLITYLIGLFAGKNRVIKICHNIIALPQRLIQIIMISISHFVMPFFSPIALMIGFFAAVLAFVHISFNMILGESAVEYKYLNLYFVLTICAIGAATFANRIHALKKKRYSDIDFKEGNTLEEILENFGYYSIGIMNKERIYRTSMKFFHQDNFRFVIYICYFVAIVVTSIMKLGKANPESFSVNSGLGVLMLSFGTYIGFERIWKNREIFKIRGEIKEKST